MGFGLLTRPAGRANFHEIGGFLVASPLLYEDASGAKATRPAAPAFRWSTQPLDTACHTAAGSVSGPPCLVLYGQWGMRTQV